MPCCSITVKENFMTAPADSTKFSAAVSGFKLDLPSIHAMNNTINLHPVLIEKQWGAESLLFLGVSDLTISSGKFRAMATFQMIGKSPSPEVARMDWTELFLALWE